MKILFLTPLFILIFLVAPEVSARPENRKSCYCKISVGKVNKEPIRSAHYSSIEQCQKYLTKKEQKSFWNQVCEGKSSVEYTLSCNREELKAEARCVQKTPYHGYLLFTESAKVPEVDHLFTFHNSSKFNFRKTFSYLAEFMRKNSGLDLENSLFGGIYDSKTKNRIDLTIVDFVYQVSDLVAEDFPKLLPELDAVIDGDPIKNFPSFYQWFDQSILTNKKLRRKASRIIPIIYLENSVAYIDQLKILSKSRFFNPKYKKELTHYNRIVLGANKTEVFKAIKTTYFPNLKTPITAGILSKVNERELRKLINEVNEREHIKRVQGFYQQDTGYDYVFAMKPHTGISVLYEGFKKDNHKDKMSRKVVEVFNYIHTTMDKSLLAKVFANKVDNNVNINVISPLVVKENYEFWEDVVQEDSWAKHISYENDAVLLILRKWMKKHQNEIKEKAKSINLATQLRDELDGWKDKRRPKRGLTLDLYPILEKVYPDRPWEKHYLLDAQGNKIVLGEVRFKKGIRSIYNSLKGIFKIENIASTITATAVASLSGNPYLSASASTLIHDFIVAKKYGYEVDEYLIKHTPRNLMGSLVFAAGFAPGRTADAVFTGAMKGGFQAAITGRPIKLGMIVGGISGGTLQQLPPEVSNWVVPGENQNTLNIFSELAEKSFFHGINGAVIGYFDDGDWKNGAQQGAIFGAGMAAVNILVFGVRYDANAYVSDSEIAEYNHLHNHEEGYYQGEELTRTTSDMAERYGKEINITRDDLKRAEIRKDGYLQGTKPSNILATNYGGPFGSQISMGPDAIVREETILHEVMHTRQAQQGRMLFLLSKSPVFDLPEGFWEEYKNVGNATLPDGYYRTFIHVDLTGDLK